MDVLGVAESGSLLLTLPFSSPLKNGQEKIEQGGEGETVEADIPGRRRGMSKGMRGDSCGEW